ncbi:melanoma-derived growth regulatory protein isoform X2 [Mustela erminea]|uniref:melanoma-derived growth regulatory protein isoform X2 n=1 Tax=Mustela erminea TaxID=36723 RepID=UPI0013871760|nr:melanoma-derived growth regulatory protein isoform X2 [Mustela erminea]
MAEVQALTLNSAPPQAQFTSPSQKFGLVAKDPISMAVALQDYVAPDCRFLTIHRGQVVYVFSKLKGRGRLFWGGSVQGDYYGDLAARLGYFPSSVVREDQTLKPGKIDVKTDKWDFYCQ